MGGARRLTHLQPDAAAFHSAKDVHISRETSHTYFRITRSTMITHNVSGKVSQNKFIKKMKCTDLQRF